MMRPTSYQSTAYSYPTPRSDASSPNTPELLRSDSYDSQMSNADPISPLTPNVDYIRPALYSVHSQDYPEPSSKRPGYASTVRSNSYEEEHSATSPMPDRPGKRYPCRYRDSHGCEKTFTTSGHASRHSKIHTAEKAVQCTFPGCQKKFTRADNMKQHLETHYKDKSRSSGGSRTHRAALAEARRNSTTGRSRVNAHDGTLWESEMPPHAGWDARGPVTGLPILNRPSATRAPSSGLDALAMAVACQAE